METEMTLSFIDCFWEQLPNHHLLETSWLVMLHQVGIASKSYEKYVCSLFWDERHGKALKYTAENK